jgi:hypothetical protein
MAEINTTALAAFKLALASNDEGTSAMGGGGGSDRQQLISAKMSPFLIACGFSPITVQVCRETARVSINSVGSFVSSHPLRSQTGMYIDWSVKEAAVALRDTIKESGHDIANGYQRLLYSALTLIFGEAKNLPSKTNFGEADVINNKMILSLWEKSDKTFAKNSAPASAQLVYRIHNELNAPYSEAVMLTANQTYNVLSKMKRPAGGVPVSVPKTTVDLDAALNPVVALGTLCLLSNCEYGFINLPIYVSVFQALER